MDLREELDASIGHGPPLPHPVERVAAGRTALRRRRTAVGVGGALAAAAMVVPAVLLAGGSPDSAADLPPAATPPGSATPAPSPTGDAEPTTVAWEGNLPVRYLDGELEIRPGVVVHEHLENPYGLEPPNRSDALDLTFKGKRTWTIVEYRKRGWNYAASEPSNGWASFGDWVADQVGAAADGWPDTLRLTDDGTVVASEGSEILQRTDDPQLGDTFAPPGTPTGAAVVRAAEDGVGYFVVWRVVDGELDVITVPPRDVVGATFEQLLNHARGQYASGEGLR